MCWSPTATIAMVGLGAAATMVTRARGEPPAIWGTLAYFTAMEGLQALGYPVIDQCDNGANRTVTVLSYLHIAFQPLVINAFVMSLMPEGSIAPQMRRRVYMLSGIATILLLARLLPLDALGTCPPGSVLCGPGFCTISGDWHLGWEVPLNDMWGQIPLLGLNGWFPAYMAAVFLLPLFYGAWRFVLFHLLFGPVLAMTLTTNPNEMPAIWCLFSVGLLLIGLSPAIRRTVAPAQAKTT